MNHKSSGYRRRRAGRPAVLVILAACWAPGAVLADSADKFKSRWEWGFGIGVSSWNDLGNVRSSLGGDFDQYGFALDMSVHRSLRGPGRSTLLLGADLGFFSTESAIPGIFEDLVQRGVYLTPSMRLRFGESGRGHVDLEAGAGWYNTDFAEVRCDDYNLFIGGPVCTELNAPFDKNAFGGYAGIRAGFNRWFTTGFRVHFTDFGEVTGLPTVSGELGGPIYTLMVGGRF